MIRSTILASMLALCTAGCLDPGLKTSCMSKADCLNGYTCAKQACVRNDGVDLGGGDAATSSMCTSTGGAVTCSGTTDLAGTTGTVGGADIAFSTSVDGFVVTGDLSFSCIPMMGSTTQGGGSDMSIIACSLNANCSDGINTEAITCDQQTCQCLVDGTVVGTFAQTQACPTDDGGGPGSWLAQAWSSQCKF